MITRSKFALASQVSQKVYEEFSKILAEYKDGKLNEEEASLRYQSLKNIKTLPEDMTNGNIEEILKFIDNEDYTLNLLTEMQKKDEKLDDMQKVIHNLKKESYNKDILDHNNKIESNALSFATNIFNKEQSNYLKNSLYLLGALIPDLINALISLILSKMLFVKKFFENNDLLYNQSFLFIFLFVLLTWFSTFYKTYFVEKSKVQSAWLSLKFLTFSRNKKNRINKIASDYINENKRPTI